MTQPLSVRQQLDGRCILITGGLGFLGSVCLEQLLRLSEVQQVNKVYLLVRGKRNLSANERVQKLLCGPLFHKLHAEAAAGGRNPFSKVHGVEGDLELPGLGLCAADKQLLLSEVDIVAHAAASLTLDAHIQDALRSNFNGTKALLQLAGEMTNLQAFVQVSTYYVNNFKPYNTPVKEEVHYPTLQLAGDPRTLTATQLVDHLLTVSADTAAAEVSKIMSRINFVSTYAFSKLLTEQLLDDPATLPGVAKAIIRPSLISCIANDPYQGYIGGFAGSPGYCLTYGMGCFHDIHSVAFASDAIPDLIPVDATAALTIAAAAGARAHGPYGEGRARVYHSASAESYPQHATDMFEYLNKFWSSNPPVYSLPFTRYPTYSGRHHPTTASMWLGTMITSAKVWGAVQLLKWSGKPRQAKALVNGFKAFCVQNTPEYARSIVSCVDNVRELEASLVDSERDDWRCVWEQTPGMFWEQYSYTSLAGVRAICLRLPESTIEGVPHNFSRKQGLSDPSRMRQWMEPAGTISSSSNTVSNRSRCRNKSPDSSTGSLRSSISSSSSDLSDAASAASNEETGVTVTVCLQTTAGSEKGAAAAAHSDALAPAVGAPAAAAAH